MKTYVVEVEWFRESFGGYDHRDGTETLKIQARNDDSAEKKARKQLNKDSEGWSQARWFRITNIEEKK